MAQAKKTAKTLAGQGFRMPAEWEPHAATWLGWPHNETDWPGKLETIRWVYGEMVRKIGAGERVRILVNSKTAAKEAAAHLKSAGADLSVVDFVVHATNRGWTRDSGPIHVKKGKGKKAELAIVHFHFNAWAKYDDWQKDRKVPEAASQFLDRRLFDIYAKGKPFVAEGGGIEVNGKGTVLTTEECYLHPTVQVRNPGMTREEFGKALQGSLGATNVQWLAGGPVGDDTHGHIDDICRFVDERRLVLIREKNPSDINYRALEENWERVEDLRLEDGSKPEVIELPMPGPVTFDGERLPASYANFYIANAAVLVPTFNDPMDRVALGILGELFRDRPVVGIHAVDLVLGFGSLHCLTQQEPAAS